MGVVVVVRGRACRYLSGPEGQRQGPVWAVQTPALVAFLEPQPAAVFEACATGWR